MHNLLYITFNKDNAKTSEEARIYAFTQLETDTGFVRDEGSRFNSPISDWFVIGGRWSGDLSVKLLEKDFFKECEKFIPTKSEYGYSTQETEENKNKFQQLWEMLGGKGNNPYNRDDYDHHGAEDDAMLVDNKIYDKILKDFEGYDQADHKDGDGLGFTDLDYDMVNKDFIDKKWLIVVDYHY